MLRKLRLKFVGLSMSLVAVLLGVVVYAVFLSARDNLDRISRDVLRRVMRDPSGQYAAAIGKGDVTLPYFTVEIWPTNVYLIGGSYSELENSELLQKILLACVEQSEKEGQLKEYGLRYLRRNEGLYVRIVFVDMSMETEILRNMVRSQLMIAFVALLPLLGVSVLLSRWAVAPVEKAWEQQRQFLSDASHELKTPLTVILSNAELLEASELAERPRRWTENIRAESVRMKTLVEEMLTLARADNAPSAPVFGDASLSEIALDCALSFEPVAFEAGKPLLYEIAPDVVIRGDAEKLRRLVSILLDNALKYGADGGAVSLTLERAERQARLTVSNPGTPIPPETLAHIFERFYRGDASRGESSGFGLGLSIAESVARQHKATLRAESDESSTRFSALFPLPRKNPGRNPKASSASPAPDMDASGPST